jgi:hypothetical protein
LLNLSSNALDGALPGNNGGGRPRGAIRDHSPSG